MIAAIRIEFQRERMETEQGRHEQNAAIAILKIGPMYDGVHQQALRINEDVAFLPSSRHSIKLRLTEPLAPSALDLLASVVTDGIDRGPLFPRS